MTATTIKFVCNGCGERLSVPEKFAGRKGACPNCKSINRVPLRGFSETQNAAPARKVPEIPALARANGNGAAHVNGNGNGAATLTPPPADLRGRIQPAVPPIEPAPSRMRSLIDPPPNVKTPEAVREPAKIKVADPMREPARAKASQPVREQANSNGAYVHPLAEAVAAPVTDWSDPACPGATNVASDESTVITIRAHGVLAPDELTPGERWKRAWEEPRPGVARKIFGNLLPRRSASTSSRPGARTLDDGFSMPLKVGMLLGGVAGLVGMIYLVLYFLLWSHLNMMP